MDWVGKVLLAWFLGSLVLLALLETATIQQRIPTISARVQGMARSARIVIVVVCVAVGVLLDHFFG